MQTVSLDKFPLKWRWTEEKYALFSETELSQIAPLDIASAKDVWESSLKFVSNSNDFSPRTDLFVDIERIEASDENAARNWLAARLPQCNIVVSWQPALAVLTNANLFIKYWSDFCYPSSDDASVWPVDESWILHYSHYGVLWHGKCKSV